MGDRATGQDPGWGHSEVGPGQMDLRSGGVDMLAHPFPWVSHFAPERIMEFTKVRDLGSLWSQLAQVWGTIFDSLKYLVLFGS